jgi:hypothetical protein
MPRTIASAYRIATHSQFRTEVDLCFLTITQSAITPIYLVWDTKDFKRSTSGNTHIGFPFDLELLTDDETAPTARLQIQNISPQIGDAIRTILTPPQVKIELCVSTDWTISGSPPYLPTISGTPAASYTGDQLNLINVQVDAMFITGQLVGWDYGQRVWPAERATEVNFPNLFRV